MWLELDQRKNWASFLRLLKWLFFSTILFTFLGFASNVSLIFDLLSHFRAQYFVIQLIALIWMARYLKTPKVVALAVLTVVVLIINGSLFWNYASPKPFEARHSGQSQIKLLQMNVLVFNKNYAKVLETIRQSDADIVSIQEVNETWFKQLKDTPVFNSYPYQITHLKAGDILLSKIPLENGKIISFPEVKLGKAIYRKEGGYILARLSLNGERVSLINFHPPVPISPKHIKSYLKYLSLLAAEKTNLESTVILLGDLNTTPWSYFYRQYLQKLGLKDAKAHHYMPTWPTYMPWFYLPIDHVFVSSNVQTLSQKTGPFNGSDHFPVEIELQIP